MICIFPLGVQPAASKNTNSDRSYPGLLLSAGGLMSFYPLPHLACFVDRADTNIWRFKSVLAAVCNVFLFCPGQEKRRRGSKHHGVMQLHGQCSITTEPRD